MSETDIAIIQWAARHAPDVTDAEIAVSLGVPLYAVQRVAADVQCESASKMREYRRIIGVLAAQLHVNVGWHYSKIAKVAKCSRQHIHRCTTEAKHGG